MCGPRTDQTLVPRCRGAPKDPSPNTEAINQEPSQKASGVKSISRIIGSSRQSTIPCSPFPSLPRSCLRDQPARGRTTGEPVPPGGFGPVGKGGRTHPVMSASHRASGVLSRGGWSPASKTGAKQMACKDAHAFASTACVDPSLPRSWFRSSSSRQGMEPSAPSPPMKSTATRS